MRFSLRTLLFILLLGPPLIAGAWARYSAWRAREEKERMVDRWLHDVGEAIITRDDGSTWQRGPDGVVRELSGPDLWYVPPLRIPLDLPTE
jgi:hypothetical protein